MLKGADRIITEDKQSGRGGGLDEQGWSERECRVIAREKEKEL